MISLISCLLSEAKIMEGANECSFVRVGGLSSSVSEVCLLPFP